MEEREENEKAIKDENLKYLEQWHDRKGELKCINWGCNVSYYCKIEVVF